MIEPGDICFVGLGTSAVCYYRCMLPAMALGSDWCGLQGEPPKMKWATGLTGRGHETPQSTMPALTEYKVVILQQPRGRGWLDIIKELQEHGVKVIFEVDDYLHGVRKVKGHDFAEKFSKKNLASYELTMRVCDAVIASTEYIARRYRRFNSCTFVCENGLDIARYDLELPERDTTTIGWAGGTGHTESIMPWLQATAKVMADHPEACFASIGQPFANGFHELFGKERAIAVPFCAIEQYPGAMTLMDIALAPAGKGNFARGKSNLRWLEASALGIPVIADPSVYPQIEDGVDGFHAQWPTDVENILRSLVGDPELRTAVGATARERVRADWAIAVKASAWLEACEAVVSSE